MKKLIDNEKAFTLIELLATLTIAMLLMGVTFGVVTTAINFNSKTTAFTDVRQESNLIVTQIREKHYNEQPNTNGYNLCENELLHNNSTIQHLSLNNQNIAGGGCTSINPADDIKLELVLRNNENQIFNLETIIEGKEEFILPPLTIKKPSGEETFGEYVRNNNIYVYSNMVEITGSSTIKGQEATVVIKENFQPASASKNYIEAKDIYIKGDMMMRNFALGNMSGPMSNIYVDGGITFAGGPGPRIYGYLQHTGELEYQSNLNSSVMMNPPEQVDEITFPAFDIPNLREENWYTARGYTNDSSLRNEMKYFGLTLSFSDWGRNQFHNVSIVSQGNISLNGNVHVSGVLFAPNGIVNINGSSTFKGIIIAKQVSVTGNSHVTFEMPSGNEALPF